MWLRVWSRGTIWASVIVSVFWVKHVQTVLPVHHALDFHCLMRGYRSLSQCWWAPVVMKWTRCVWLISSRLSHYHGVKVVASRVVSFSMFPAHFGFYFDGCASNSFVIVVDEHQIGFRHLVLQANRTLLPPFQWHFGYEGRPRLQLQNRRTFFVAKLMQSRPLRRQCIQ